MTFQNSVVKKTEVNHPKKIFIALSTPAQFVIHRFSSWKILTQPFENFFSVQPFFGRLQKKESKNGDAGEIWHQLRSMSHKQDII